MKSQIHMAEATRLTREGRLDEAMAVLRGIGTADTSPKKPHNSDYIEMTQSPDGTWDRASETPQPGKAKPGRGAEKPRIDLAHMVTRFRSSLNSPIGGHVSPSVPEGATFSRFTVADRPGRLASKLYVPSSYTGQPVALVVMLHGCTQSPDDFALGTGMNGLAEKHGFLVLYPEQATSANMNRCWNWFNTGDQRRDAGEPAILVDMVKQVMNAHAVDPAKVFVAGLSAGAAMAAILGARYPDVFSAVAVHSGLAVGSAHDMPSAFAAMGQGASRCERSSDVPVRTIIIHGDADTTVSSRNGERITEQVLGGRSLKASTLSARDGDGRHSTRTTYRDELGQNWVEHWILHGAGHAWSGGDAAGSFTDARGPNASREIVRFFLEADSK